MSLRRKTLLIVIAMLTLLIGMMFVVEQLTIKNSYLQLEQASARTDMQRIINYIDDELFHLGAVNADWAYWDDTYEFVRGNNPSYIHDNLTDEALMNLGISLMQFVDTSGDVVYEKMVNVQTGSEVPFPAGLSPDAMPSVYEAALSGGEIQGVVHHDGTPTLLAARPVLTSQYEGPQAGVMIVGICLKDYSLSEFSDEVGYPLAFYLLDAPDLPDHVTRARDSLRSAGDILVEPVNDELLRVYTMYYGLSGEPELILAIEMPRDIYQIGLSTLMVLHLLALIGLIALAALSVVILDRLVIYRLANLSETIHTIRDTGKVDTPVSLKGNDELSRLADDIQHMLHKIADYQFELQQARDVLEQRVHERTGELSVANEQLAQARDEALNALRFKEQVLANVSHDSRTPLSVISLRTEMLLAGIYGEINEEQRSKLEGILLSTGQLSAYFENLVTASQLQAKALKIEMSRVAPVETINEVIASMQPLAEGRGLQLLAEHSCDPDICIQSDGLRIKQVLYNLVDNALKFTDAGSVVVKSGQSDDGHFLISVKDTGIGIPDEAQDTIFGAFWQVDGSATRSTNRGVGLGLSIVKELVGLMDGHLAVDSTIGVGTEITVMLPLTAMDAVPAV